MLKVRKIPILYTVYSTVSYINTDIIVREIVKEGQVVVLLYLWIPEMQELHYFTIVANWTKQLELSKVPIYKAVYLKVSLCRISLLFIHQKNTDKISVVGYVWWPGQCSNVPALTHPLILLWTVDMNTVCQCWETLLDSEQAGALISWSRDSPTHTSPSLSGDSPTSLGTAVITALSSSSGVVSCRGSSQQRPKVKYMLLPPCFTQGMVFSWLCPTTKSDWI